MRFEGSVSLGTKYAVSGSLVALALVAVIVASIASYSLGVNVATTSANASQKKVQSLVNSLQNQNADLQRQLSSRSNLSP